MPLSSIILLTIFIINLLLIFTMIFFERREPQTIFSWAIILTLLPVVGFILYFLFGNGLSLTTKIMIKRKKNYTKDYYNYLEWQNIDIDTMRKNAEKYSYAEELIRFNKSCDKSNFSSGNKVKVFVSGKEMLTDLENDLTNAKSSINLEYYIFGKDKTGKKIMNILCMKAKSGVKVKLIYDAVGCIKVPKRFFKKLVRCGGEIAQFFPPFLGLRLINPKINYRNHRKIAVIDGLIGYTGGINIRDDHMMGLNKKLSPWRDTHIKIEGRAVWDLQNVFFNDFRATNKNKILSSELIKEGYFNENCLKVDGDIGAQIITSGPETNEKYIEDAYIRMITLAKKRIYIQTPYFIPDEMFVKSLILAKRSGVDVRVMIPQKPDKKIVYYSTLSYIQELLENDVKVYQYKGFIHSKTILVDDLAVAIGSCNMDNRSFALNFELSAILYNKDFVNENKLIFESDSDDSVQLSLEMFNKKFFATKFMQAIFRLFSSIM